MKTIVSYSINGVNYRGVFPGHLRPFAVRDALVSPLRPRELRCGMSGIKTITHESPGLPDVQVYGVQSKPAPRQVTRSEWRKGKKQNTLGVWTVPGDKHPTLAIHPVESAYVFKGWDKNGVGM